MPNKKSPGRPKIVDPALKTRSVTFRLREEALQSLDDLLREFNYRTKMNLSRTDIIEALILNGLRDIRKKVDDISPFRDLADK